MLVCTGREMSTLAFNIRFEDDRLPSDLCKIFTSFERSSVLRGKSSAAEAPDSAGDSVMPEPRQL